MASSETHRRHGSVVPLREWGRCSDREAVACIDPFGILIEYLVDRASGAAACARGGWELENGPAPAELGRTGAEVPLGPLVALVNSYGPLEAAERNGSAASRLLPGAVGEA